MKVEQFVNIFTLCVRTSPSVVASAPLSRSRPASTAIENELAEADALEELRLLQERRNLTSELATMGSGVGHHRPRDRVRQGRQVVQRAPGDLLRDLA